MTYARVICDSISPEGHRLTTLQVEFHRFVLAEFNTHRVFSRNSASSRAIPFGKMAEKVEFEPAYPVSWPGEQKGMQGGDELDDTDTMAAEHGWNGARLSALGWARQIHRSGLHKSVVNRVLEPFLMHTVVVTATDWDNFFEQRCSPLAQPEIRLAAEMMQKAMAESTPNPLKLDEWHMPYIDEEDMARVLFKQKYDKVKTTAQLVKISAARCARVSYLTQEGIRDHDVDLKLYERLVTARPWHASPLEHVATPWKFNVATNWEDFVTVDGLPVTAFRDAPRFGNFIGWRQLRLELEATP